MFQVGIFQFQCYKFLQCSSCTFPDMLAEIRNQIFITDSDKKLFKASNIFRSLQDKQLFPGNMVYIYYQILNEYVLMLRVRV
jgi:hypothetical protein